MRIARVLRLSRPQLTPRTAVAIARFRAARGWASTCADIPADVQSTFRGNKSQVYIKDVFPQAWCYAQVDVRTFAIRWAPICFVSLNTVINVQKAAGGGASHGSWREGASLGSWRESDRSASTNSMSSADKTSSAGRQFLYKKAACVLIAYSGRGCVSRQLELRMSDDCATAWALGLRKLLDLAPHAASPTHWRWVLSCMAATSARGATGSLHRSELRSLMNRANTAGVSVERIEEAFRSVDVHEEQLGTPLWLRPMRTCASRETQLLNAQQIAGLLLQLSISSSAITDVFERYASDGQMNQSQWLGFWSEEQVLLPAGDGVGVEMPEHWHMETSSSRPAETDYLFEVGTKTDLQTDATIGVLQFTTELLNSHNNAVAPALAHAAAADEENEPFAHYWTASSHKCSRWNSNSGLYTRVRCDRDMHSLRIVPTS